jgi:hypothetical protein
MRNQFYCDRKDVWKWSLLLELAGEQSHIYQIAMLTADETEHKLDVGDPGPCDLRALNFFQLERAKKRDIYGVEELLPGRITVLNRRDCEHQYYSNGLRSLYFAKVTEAHKVDLRPKVILLDPDNGTEVKKPNKKHVRLDDVSRIWNVLRRDDHMVIYQHHPRDFRMRKDPILLAEYRDGIRQKVGKAISQKTETINDRTHDAVSFFWIHKKNDD